MYRTGEKGEIHWDCGVVEGEGDEEGSEVDSLEDEEDNLEEEEKKKYEKKKKEEENDEFFD